MTIPTLCSITEYPSDIATSPNMVEEIERLFSSAMLDMLGQPSVCIFPRRPAPVALKTPGASKGEVPSDPGEIVSVYLKQLPPSPQESSQVGMANIIAHSSSPPSPTPGTPERDSSPTPSPITGQFYHPA